MRGKRTIKVLFKTVRSLTIRLRDLRTASKKNPMDSIGPECAYIYKK